MNDSLKKYPHIEFTRAAVSKRAKETKGILSELELIAKHPDGEHRLYRNPMTMEYWQYASAWNWGAKPYCFLVPEISEDEWYRERYVDPDELLIFVAVLSEFLSVPGHRQIKNLKNHIESLQRIGNLPKSPEGRWFDPYIRENIIPNLDEVDETVKS